MITLPDCISILDAEEQADAFKAFLSSAARVRGKEKSGGYRATYSLKRQGVLVHLEYVDRVWKVRAVHLYGRSESGFLPFAGTLGPEVDVRSQRARLHEAFGAPSSTGGTGKIGRFGIVDRFWERWDYESHSLRFDFEDDESTIYVACVQRPRDVKEFEKRRSAQPGATDNPDSAGLNSRSNFQFGRLRPGV